jgi:hypothetical protein
MNANERVCRVVSRFFLYLSSFSFVRAEAAGADERRKRKKTAEE